MRRRKSVSKKSRVSVRKKSMKKASSGPRKTRRQAKPKKK